MFKSVSHVPGDFILRLFLVTPDAKGCTVTELRSAGIMPVNISILIFGFRSLEHLVIGQSVGGRALVTVHPVYLVVGDFLELVAELRKLVR